MVSADDGRSDRSLRPIQLELPLALELPPKQEYWRQYRTPEQEEEFQVFLAECRQETAEMLALANLLIPERKFASLTELTTPQLAQVSSVYFAATREQPISQVHQPSKVSKPPRPYRPWSDERKFRARIARLNARLEKDFSIPEIRRAKLLDLCAENPQRFGLCLLPGAADRCPVTFNIAHLAAIEREKALRADLTDSFAVR